MNAVDELEELLIELDKTFAEFKKVNQEHIELVAQLLKAKQEQINLMEQLLQMQSPSLGISVSDGIGTEDKFGGA